MGALLWVGGYGFLQRSYKYQFLFYTIKWNLVIISGEKQKFEQSTTRSEIDTPVSDLNQQTG